jgi:thioredoxin-like negative regulator of GroEL
MLLGSLAISPPISAQAESEREFDREIQVVRSLAKDWGFVDLAQAQIEQLRQSPALTNDLSRKLAEVSAEVLFLGARRIPDLEERQKVLRQSITKFKDFLLEFEGSDEAARVRATLAEACEEYGGFLANRIELEKDPDKRKSYEEEALDVFREGIKAANMAMASLKPKIEEDNDAKVQFFLTWLRKGTLLLRWAQTVKADRSIKVQEAREELEEMVLTLGEETLIGMLGMLELSRSYDIGGSTDDAIGMFDATIDTIMMVLENPDNPPSQQRGALLFELAERAYVQIGGILQRQGKTKEALALFQKYSAKLEKFEASPSFNFGDRVMLIGAQAYFATGGEENRNKALELAKSLADRHPADFTGIKAKELIREIVESGADVGVSALFDAADGLYRSRKYAEAIQGFKRVLRSLGDDAEAKQNYALRSWALIANAYYQMGRYLEAYYAAKEGISRHAADDEETAGRLANLMADSASRKRTSTKDEWFRKLEEEAKEVVRRNATGRQADALAWREARTALADNKFDKAIEIYKKITKEYDQYELAQVRIGVAHYRKPDFAAARKTFDAYEAYTKDKFNSIPPNEPNKQTVRRRALYEMEFHRGIMIADEAFGRDGRSPQPGKLKDVVDAFKGYRERAKAYPELATRASFDLIKAYIDLEKIDEAELEYAALKKAYPTDSTVAFLAISLFNARRSIVEAVEAELEGIEPTAGNQSKLRDVQRRLRAEIRKALDFAKIYIEIEREPNYSLLRNAAKLALRIEDFEIARTFLRKIVSTYGDQKDYAQRIDTFVKPDLAEIDLLDGKFQQALDSVNDALKAVKSNRSKLYFQLIRMKAFALAGYRTQLDDLGQAKRQNGLGRFKEAYDLMWLDYNRYIKSQVEEFSLEWYQFYFDCMDIALKVAGNQDTSFLGTAKKFYRRAASTNDFKTLRDLGPKGERLAILFRNLEPR